VHEQWSDRTAAKDLDGPLEHITPDIVSYEHMGPLQHSGIDDVREVRRHGLESLPGWIDFDIPDLAVHVNGDLAVTWAWTGALPRASSPGVAAPLSSSGATASGRHCTSTCRSRRRVSNQAGYIGDRRTARTTVSWTLTLSSISYQTTSAVLAS
jgi:hypothetical protein